MSNLTDFFPSGGGGLTPKFEEFNASGTFTPTQALIDAGGYIEVFLVGGGNSTNSDYTGGGGGEVIIKKMYLLSTTSCSITIGARGSVGSTSSGGSSVFSGSSAGGQDITATGGTSGAQNQKLGASWGSKGEPGAFASAATGVFGYGAGGSGYGSGVQWGKTNSGQGSDRYNFPGSGYCLIKWYE